MTGDSSSTEPATYDYFISYATADREWAEWMAWQLEAAGRSVLVQAWDFVAGHNWVSRMSEGVHRARHTIALLSPEYLKSAYTTAEWQAVWASDPTGLAGRLMVVRVADCSLPGLLSEPVSVDLFELDETTARKKLIDMVRRVESGRSKPFEKPPFPGPARASGSARAVFDRPLFPLVLPTTWNVPARNPNFTGRERDLATIEKRIRSAGAVTVVSLRGMGGVGKSRLAAEYAYQHATEYDVVWWIAADHSAQIADEFGRLAAALNLPATDDPDQTRARVHAALLGKSWLLIFDDADSTADVRPWIPRQQRSRKLLGHTLITTRRNGFGVFGPVANVDVMSTHSSVDILLKRMPDLDEASAAALSDELGGLPLALEQAAAYLDRTMMPPQDYLRLLRHRVDDLVADGWVDSQEATIAALLAISLQRISKFDPAAVQLLNICVNLAPEPIPLYLFTEFVDELPQPLRRAAKDATTFSDTVAVLVDYSLVRRGRDAVILHRMTQASVRAGHGGAFKPTTTDRSTEVFSSEWRLWRV